MSAVLGVSTWAYLPFCFFNIASPVLSVLYGFTGFKVERTAPQEIEAEPARDAEAVAPAPAKHSEAAD